MLSLQQRFPASRGLSRRETSASREQQSLHDVFFINTAVRDGPLEKLWGGGAGEVQKKIHAREN